MTRRLASPSHLFSFLVVASLIFIAPERASAGSEFTLHSFDPVALGEFPSGGLIADSAGNLYGVAANGGAYRYGTVFEFVPNKQGGWTEQVLYNFQNGVDGGQPVGGVIFDAAGNLYGITNFGGSGYGTVFELKPNPDGSWTERTLHNIDEGVGSSNSGLVFDQNGNLYGVGTGGVNAAGIVFELSPSSSGEWTETVLQPFSRSGSGGDRPVGPLVIDRSGNVFGVASSGGNGCSQPGCGLVFELSPSLSGKWTETVIHNFVGGNDGNFPLGGLISDGAGNLYGTTFYGGTGCYACGTVFELTPAGNGQWTETILYNFQGGSDGQAAEYPLIFDGAGNLYGATYGGGGLGFCDYGGCGTVFQLTPRGAGQWSESVLWRFNNSIDGYDPSGSVFLSADGKVFGELYYGHDPGQNGMLFALSNIGGQWTLTSVSGFEDSDGAWPETALVADSRGNLYGTTAFGGALGIGSVFALTPARGGSWNEKMIYSFPNGGYRSSGGPSLTTQPSPLIVDVAGNLYGEARGGGLRNQGMVYELSPAPGGTWTEKTLYSFAGGVGGEVPSGGLLMDHAGNLYGTTQYGGLGTLQGVSPSGYGTVFELIPVENGSWSRKTLYLFGGYPADGAQPEAGLIFDPAGNLYGTTATGGSGTCARKNGTIIGCGTAFQLTPENGAWRETILHSFLGGTQDGQSPAAGLVLDQSGNLYGTTVVGGSGYGQFDPSGTVFELSPATGGEWNESLLFEFPDFNGQGAPLGNLIFDAFGNLFSTTSGTSGTGYPAGSVFKLSPNSSGGWNYQVVYSFTDLGIGSPQAGVIFGPNGYLYGTTDNGGNFSGTVFAIAR